MTRRLWAFGVLDVVPLRALARTLTALLWVVLATIAGLLALRWSGLPRDSVVSVYRLDVLGNCSIALLVVVFFGWFGAARLQADGLGWRQRHKSRLSIGSWLVPVVNLWLPFRIMADIWRAGLPAPQRCCRALLPGTWWAAWLLAGLTNLAVAGRSAAGIWQAPVLTAATSPPGMVFLLIAGLALIVIVRRVSTGPVGTPADLRVWREREPALASAPAPAAAI